MDEIAEVAKPIIILTGGEPLLRPDVSISPGTEMVWASG